MALQTRHKIPHIAPEMWAEIISFCPKTDSSRLRLVSHVFDSIARRRVFSDLSFLIEDKCRNDHDNQTRAENMRRCDRNWAVLELMATDPSFARMVKKLRLVVLHMDKDLIGETVLPQVRERMT